MTLGKVFVLFLKSFPLIHYMHYAYTNDKYIVLLTVSLYSSVLNYANVWVTQK